jgi:type I restriction enzyme M protein
VKLKQAILTIMDRCTLKEGEHIRVFDNEDFVYNRITVKRPLRFNFAADKVCIARLKET